MCMYTGVSSELNRNGARSFVQLMIRHHKSSFQLLKYSFRKKFQKNKSKKNMQLRHLTVLLNGMALQYFNLIAFYIQ